jgi:type VI secretion system secreted protein Hcp
MAITTFIKLDGIEGEATDRDHRGEIEVLSWSWGLTRPLPGAGGAGTGKATPLELRVVHRYDKASPLIGKRAAAGQHIATAVLSARKAGEGQKDFLQVTMKEVFITSVTVTDGGEGPSEEVAMSYRSIDFAYSQQTASGRPALPVKFGWDTKTNQVT